ncbi:hypothetical protein SERLA73DRAFT_184020 [Serpula lacrymans var. lacrymans S7.3]|uniref:HNH domain-containing protein n=2 Tax=Serpula lacrymans var. lacrymans TaxID=341189 RepID=F8Q2D6_SERL3|nr:uncharacterized protein SERLADRAFT_471472 [Serpula lacrymans var. lacrymans S7.9]EGN97347.1 hypothetical protein SERLA73DRAFT_184020 [Serpula lacrymans var. lacrymans S7.3]EGO22939.1 hypothetical protein SERLADRAFT_471472 [Serpula lacrymans var. lacrymans S7.9]
MAKTAILMAHSDLGSLQFSSFKDCLARRIISLSDFVVDSSNDSDSELDEFASFLALEAWPAFPTTLRQASYETRNTVPSPDDLSFENTPVAFGDTLVAYGLTSDYDESLEFLRKAVGDYIGLVCAPPPVWSSTRTKQCELCEREIPLTYHHLIPRATHAKVLKKNLHPESMLNSVAWLCRPCHTVVHHVANNDELAREYYTIELLQGREDIQKWRKYAAKQRYGVRRN